MPFLKTQSSVISVSGQCDPRLRSQLMLPPAHTVLFLLLIPTVPLAPVDLFTAERTSYPLVAQAGGEQTASLASLCRLCLPSRGDLPRQSHCTVPSVCSCRPEGSDVRALPRISPPRWPPVPRMESATTTRRADMRCPSDWCYTTPTAPWARRRSYLPPPGGLSVEDILPKPYTGVVTSRQPGTWFPSTGRSHHGSSMGRVAAHD